MSGDNRTISDEQLASMNNDELARLGTELDGVDVRFRKQRWPVEGTKAEKRAARTTTFWLVLSIICFLAFIGVFLFWPHEYKALGEEGHVLYTWYTPLLGITAGLAIGSLGAGLVHFTKKFIPEEISVQTRHDGPSAEVDRRTTVALLNDAWETSTLGRRTAIKGGLIGAGTLFGVATLVSMGGIVRNPWKVRHQPNSLGDGTLWTSGWTQVRNEKVYLGRDTGRIAKPHDTPAGEHWSTEGVNRLVRLRPEDLQAGSMETVFPLPESAMGSYEEQMHQIHGGRNSVMLIRLRAEDAARAIQREGQEDFHYGDYYAYSKICTHLGCPTSLYEAQTNRILCPCHQSQFDALHFGKPVFGPAARALPELPIAVDEEGYFYAKADFAEPVGPAFWERRS